MKKMKRPRVTKIENDADSNSVITNKYLPGEEEIMTLPLTTTVNSPLSTELRTISAVFSTKFGRPVPYTDVVRKALTDYVNSIKNMGTKSWGEPINYDNQTKEYY